MLAVFLSVLSLFSWQDRPVQQKAPAADSVKHPRQRKNQIAADSAGHFIQVNRIVLIGNSITRDKIILRELTLKSGDIIYSTELESTLDLDKKKLINTRLFNTVVFKILESDPGRIDLIVTVDERWYTFPSPIFELSDRNFNEWWQNYNHDFRRVNYGLRLYQFNMRGRNETLRAVAQLGFLRKFELTYRMPYIDRKQKQGLIFDFVYAETKNLAYQTLEHKLVYHKDPHPVSFMRGGSVSYTYRNSFYDQHLVKAEYRSNSIADTVVLLNPNYFGDSRSRQRYAVLYYQFVSDHRDYFGYPLNGYYLNANISRLGIFKNDDVRKTEVSVNYARFIDLKKGFYFSNNVIGFWSNPQDQPYNAFGALGYRKQFIRGYEIYVIEGPYYAMNKTTFKKKIFGRTYDWKDMPIKQFRHIPLSIYLKAYGDLGYVKNYGRYENAGINTRLSDHFLSGAGVGLDIVGSYDTVIRFEYSFNAQGDNGLFIHIKREF